MEVSEADRRRVHNKLVDIAGETEANIIMEMLPKPDLVTQISELRAELHIEVASLRNELHTEIGKVRAEMQAGFADVRAEMQTGFAEVRAEMQTGFAEVDTKFAQLMAKNEHDMRLQLIWLMSTIIAMSGVIIGMLR